MWRVPTGLILSAALVANWGCASPRPTPSPAADSAEAAPSTRPGGPARVTLVVHGMGCPLCANNVDKQLLAVAGVEAVHVDLGSDRVAVRLSSAGAASKDDLARAVARSG